MILLRRLILTPIFLIYRPIVTTTVGSTSSKLGIVDLILSEHKHMRDEYEHFKSLDDNAELDQRVRQWIRYISLHGHKEEIAFYPKVESYLNDEKKGGHHLISHGIKEHRQLESELKKLADQPRVQWKQIRKAVDKLMHHLKEEEADILEPLRSKLDQNLQFELAQQFEDASKLASERPHPELSKKPEKAPQENIEVAKAEKQQEL